MKISEQERAYRKQKIIETAFKMFCESGIESISMEQIAKTAGVGSTTMYRYFVNKPFLVQETLSVLWKSIGERLDLKVGGPKTYEQLNGMEQIRVQLECLKNLYVENREYILFSYEAKLYLIRNSVRITQKQYDFLMLDIREPCIAAIEKGKKDGSIPAKKDSDELFFSIWGSVRGYIVKIVIYGYLCESESMWEKGYDVLKEGILCALASGWKVK